MLMSIISFFFRSESYSCPPTEEEKKFMGDDWQRGVKPAMFKNLIGKGHKEFSGKQQQDAQEFYIHLCTVMERQHRGEANPAESLFFDVEDRMECEKTKKVKKKKKVNFFICY